MCGSGWWTPRFFAGFFLRKKRHQKMEPTLNKDIFKKKRRTKHSPTKTENKKLEFHTRNTIDGRNPANQLIGTVGYPSIYDGFIHPNSGCLGFQNHQPYFCLKKKREKKS